MCACVQEMMTSPTALAKLGWFLMEARQHQTSRHKDVIMVSPPNQGKPWLYTLGLSGSLQNMLYKQHGNIQLSHERKAMPQGLVPQASLESTSTT